MKRLFVLICVLWFVAPASAHADAFLKSMHGQWSGAGWAKETPGSEREAVRCRVKNTYAAGNQRLVFNGKCVVPGKQFNLNGDVNALDGTNVIKGRWTNPFGIGSALVNGRRSGDQVYFTFRVKDPETNRSIERGMSWTRLKDGYSITTHDLENNGAELSQIEFQRK